MNGYLVRSCSIEMHLGRLCLGTERQYFKLDPGVRQHLRQLYGLQKNEDDFNHACYCLCVRYEALGGSGYQSVRHSFGISNPSK